MEEENNVENEGELDEGYIHDDNGEDNNVEGEEMQYEDGEYENENNEEERDTLEKTLTQNIGEDVMQIPEYPSDIYYTKENFCDYNP